MRLSAWAAAGLRGLDTALDRAVMRWAPGLLRELWRYRGFVLGSVRREVAAQFRGALLGASWLLLQPLALILVYTLVFSQVMGSRLAGVESGWGYSLYLCAGLLPWTWFADAVGRLQAVFVQHGHLIKKAAFPRTCLPLIALGTATVHFAVMAGLFLLFLLAAGLWPGWPLLAVLPALAVLGLLAMALGLIAGTLFVFFRDVGPAVQVGLLFWFWLTPVVYPASVLPEAVRGPLAWNPMALLLAVPQEVMLHGRWPGPQAWQGLGAVAALALALLALGWALYRARAGEMADEL